MSDKLTNEEKLDAIYEMTLQNHEVLDTMRRQQNWAMGFRLFYWLIVLGIIGGAYYYIRPVVNTFIGDSPSAESFFEQMKNKFPEASVLNNILESSKPSPAPTTAQ